jgi:hypothetical protein
LFVIYFVNRPKRSVDRRRPKEYPEHVAVEAEMIVMVEPEKEDEPEVIQQRRDDQLEIITRSILDMEEAYLLAPLRWDLLIAMGDIYARGAFPVAKPDTSTAERLYRAAAMSPDAFVAGVAQMKMVEIKMAPVVVDDIDEQALFIDAWPGWRTAERAVEQIKMTPWSFFARPRYGGRKEDPEDEIIPPHTRIPNPNLENQIQPPTPTPVPTPAFMNDSQNVHDHAVTQTLARTLENIRTSTSADTDQQARDALELMNESLSVDMNAKDRGKVIQVISNLSTLKHSRFDQTEREVLSNVMQKIRDQKDEKLKKNLTETLVKQLASAVENGFVVCSSGKIARIAGALDGSGLKEVETARPLWAVREELGSLASKMNEEGLKGDDFRKEASRVYVEELGLNSNIIEPIIAEYAEHIGTF